MKRLLTALALALLPGAQLATAEVVRQSVRGGVALTQADGETAVRIETATGVVQAFEPGAGVALSAIDEIAGGWIAAGWRWSAEASELVLLRGGDGRAREELPPPPPTGSGLRGRPVPLADGRDLAGLAWQEGDGNLGVRAAAWTGKGWGEVEVVSPQGDDQQLALAGAVLDDGSWLLVWAAVDGEDDEILFSHRGAAGWSAPARVHEDNRVPDILPALAPLPGGGAIAAWSWLDDGHYRLRTAVFDGAAWAAGASFNEKGSLEPSFVRGEGGVAMLYMTVAPESWSVAEFDSRGRPARTARLLEPPSARPVLGTTSGAEVALRWPVLAALEPELGAASTSAAGTVSPGTPPAEAPEVRLLWEPLP